MKAIPEHIIVLGRFPPPPDGQSVATRRLASHLAKSSTVHRVNAMIPGDTPSLEKLKHYRACGHQLDTLLASYPDAPIIWASISPEMSGHWRDVTTVFPRLRGRCVIAVSHWGKFATVFEQPTTMWTAKRLVAQMDRVVFTTSPLSEACSEWLSPEQRVVIPNTLDHALIPSDEDVAERISRGPGSPFKVLFLSNMIREKGWEDVLKAASMMTDERMQYEWIFVGGWPDPAEEHRFTDMVRDLDLDNVVRHKGLIEDQQVIAKEHMEADLFILPSWLREAQPLSIMEAMAAGTPCIVANDGGMPDMIGQETEGQAGVAINARNPKALAREVARLSGPHVWEKLAFNARKRFDSLFAPEVINKEWDRLIRDVSSRRGPS